MTRRVVDAITILVVALLMLGIITQSTAIIILAASLSVTTLAVMSV